MNPENIRPFDSAQVSKSRERAQWGHSELLEHTHDAVIVWEVGGDGIIYWNRSAEMLYGWRREEVFGRITHELLQTQLTAGDTDALEDAILRSGTWAGELQHTARTGKLIHVETRIVLLESIDDRWIVAEFNREIPDRAEPQKS
jgi:two-component system CheB/CheR fusion protein